MSAILRTRWAGLLVAVAFAAGSAQAGPIVIAPNGSGGFNAYQVIESPTQTYANAIAAAQALAFPGIANLPANATPGHLASFSVESEFVTLGGMARMGGSGSIYVGLSDDPVFAAGASEYGNTSSNPIPVNGALPNEGAIPPERGSGYRFVDGANYFFHRRTGTNASIWSGGEPNNSGGAENAAEIRTDNGQLNDIPAANSRRYLVEWDLNLPDRPQLGFEANTGNAWQVYEVRGVGGQVNTAAEAAAWLYANDQFGSGTRYSGTRNTINFSDPDNSGGGDWGGDTPFLSNTPGVNDEDFALLARGLIRIPDAQAGVWTFRLRGDDGGMVRIVGQNWLGLTASDGGKGFIEGDAMVFDDPTGNANLYGTISLSGGVYQMEVVWFERGGGASVELQAAFGSFSSGTLPLVGDVQNDGIEVLVVPEPATVALLGLGGLCALRRRRRRCAC